MKQHILQKCLRLKIKAQEIYWNNSESQTGIIFCRNPLVLLNNKTERILSSLKLGKLVRMARKVIIVIKFVIKQMVS